MKPKAANEGESDGLLEYLEDIIGTSSLLPEITASHEALETINEERQVKLNRVRLVEKEKAKLEKEKREAEEFLRLRNSHTEVLNELYQLQIYQARQHEKGLKQKEVSSTHFSRRIAH
jgi:structural maintenance of chromosome 4